MPPFDYSDPMGAFESWYSADDPEQYSVTRPSDVDEYEHGVSSPYADRAMILSSQAAKAEDNAMEYLRASLNRSAEVSESQAFATALLAAIPSIGGYFIGKSVGNPELPAGYFEAGGKRSDIPGYDKAMPAEYAGGLAGVQTGAASAGGYLKGLDADQAQKNEVYTRMAALEEKQATRLQNEADQLTLAGMNQDAYAQRQEQYWENVAADRAARGSPIKEPTDFDRMSPAQQKAFIAQKAGVDSEGKPIEKPSREVGLPVAAQNELAERKALIDAATIAASNIKNFGSWADLQTARAASGLDPNADILAIQDLADRALRSRSGAAAPQSERDQVSKFVQGDFTAPPSLVANFLLKYAERERQFGASQLKTFEDLANPETRGSVFAPKQPGSRVNLTKQQALDRINELLQKKGP